MKPLKVRKPPKFMRPPKWNKSKWKRLSCPPQKRMWSVLSANSLRRTRSLDVCVCPGTWCQFVLELYVCVICMCVCEVLKLYIQLHVLLLHVQLYVQLHVLLPDMFMFQQKNSISYMFCYLMSNLNELICLCYLISMQTCPATWYQYR
jgi:hypothetical protein